MEEVDISEKVTAAKKPRWWALILANALLLGSWGLANLNNVVCNLTLDSSWNWLMDALGWAFCIAGAAGLVLQPVGVALAKRSWRCSLQFFALVALAVAHTLLSTVFIPAYHDETAHIIAWWEKALSALFLWLFAVCFLQAPILLAVHFFVKDAVAPARNAWNRWILRVLVTAIYAGELFAFWMAWASMMC